MNPVAYNSVAKTAMTIMRMNEFYHEFGLFGHPDKPGELGIYAGHARNRQMTRYALQTVSEVFLDS